MNPCCKQTSCFFKALFFKNSSLDFPIFDHKINPQPVIHAQHTGTLRAGGSVLGKMTDTVTPLTSCDSSAAE